MSALSLILMFSSLALAQDNVENEPEKPAENIQSEESEAATNLRQSIHENLETIQEDARSTEDLKEEEAEETPPAPEDQDLPPQESAQVTDSAAEPVDKKKSLIERAQAIPGYLQSLPERVPFIRERGLIFFGRAELDFAYYSSGVTKNDTGFRVRSLRAGLAKATKYNMSIKAEIDLTDGDSNFADLYVRYRNARYGLFTIGNQRVAQTLVNQTSRVSRTFMEEPLPAEAFGLGRRLALGWDLHKKKGGLHTTLFGRDLNGSIGDSGLAGRVYFNPTRTRFSLFHIGASLVTENMSRKTRFFSHPESRVTSERLVDTEIYDDIKQQQIGALEVAGARDSFMFRSEVFMAKWDRKNGIDNTFSGYYAQASWVLTGETFTYTQGKFIRIRPQKSSGAWETAVRYSQVDLNDRNIQGGEEKNLSFALNWYSPGNQFRVLSNLIFVNTDETAGNESPVIFQLRAQFHW